MMRSRDRAIAGALFTATLVHGSLFAQAPARDPVGRGTGAGALRGRVRASDGRPLRRVLIQLSGAALTGGRAVYTADEGRYELLNLPAGRYSVRATKNGYVPGSPGRIRPEEEPLQVDLAAGQVLTDLDVTLWPAAAITGQIRDEYGDPLPGATVSALEARSQQGRTTFIPAMGPRPTDDEGHFRIFSLRPGSYLLAVSMRRPTMYVADVVSLNLPEDRRGYAPTYYPGTAERSAAAPVRVGVGETRTGIDITLVPMHLAVVSGTLLDADGRPAPIGSLQLLSDDMPLPMSAPPGGPVRNGTFVVNDVPPGRYNLRAILPEPNGIGQAAVQSIDVTGADISGLVVRTVRPSMLHGRFVFDARLADRIRPSMIRPMFLQGMRVSFQPLPPNGPLVHDDFSFDAPVFPGTYDLAAGVTGVRDISVRAIRVDGTDVLDRSIDVPPNADVSGVEIELTDRVQTLEGRLQPDAALRPFVVIVFARDPALRVKRRRNAFGSPDQFGRYAIRGLLPGEYYAAAVEHLPDTGWEDPAFFERLQPHATAVTLTEGETTEVELSVAELP